MKENIRFRGMTLMLRDYNASGAVNQAAPESALYEITYCREGSGEYVIGHWSYYITDGGIMIRSLAEGARDPAFPTGRFAGFSIYISGNSEECANSERLCSGECFVHHADEKLRAAADAVCSDTAHEEAAEVFLDRIGKLTREASAAGKSRCTAELAASVKEVCAFLSQNLSTHYTIGEISERSGITPTRFKTAFRLIYGAPVYSYIKRRKMLSAAAMLKNTNKNVLDIASDFGYDNGSKFAAAFRETIGVPPREYRRLCAAQNIQ